MAPKITVWKYCWDPGLVTINKKFYDSLSPELQTAIAEAITEAGQFVNELTAREEVELVSEMEKTGAEFYTMTDEESKVFIEALKPIYDKYAPIVGVESLEKLRAEIASTAASMQ